MMTRMFDGFRLDVVDVGPVALRVRIGGEGPPIVLLHGHPRTHTTWHRVAPILVAGGRSVICPDLRGYGGSTKPATDIHHSPYAKRAMASDIVELMRRLGYEYFDLAGHDRGSYVAFRLALDHPGSVRRLALLDCVPIGDALARTDARFAAAWWHWFFYAQPEIPERVINADPAAWYGGDRYRMGSGNYEDFSMAIGNPATVQAMLEDYRAGLGIDRAADEADRTAGRRLDCPVLVVWSSGDDLPRLYGDPRAVWNAWAGDLRVDTIDSGHHMAEEAPAELAHKLMVFFGGRSGR
jgi:haloacetate dehalogenase